MFFSKLVSNHGQINSLDSSCNLQAKYEIIFFISSRFNTHACAARNRYNIFEILNYASKAGLRPDRMEYDR